MAVTLVVFLFVWALYASFVGGIAFEKLEREQATYLLVHIAGGPHTPQELIDRSKIKARGVYNLLERLQKEEIVTMFEGRALLTDKGRKIARLMFAEILPDLKTRHVSKLN